MDEPLSNDQQSARTETADGAAAMRGRATVWAVCGGLITVFFLTDWLVPLEVQSKPDWLNAVFIGLCVSQVTLIAAWAALAPGNIVVRLSWSLLLAMMMWYGLLLGCRYGQGPHLRDAIVLGAVLLAGVITLQAPLWIVKKRFGRRLTRGPEDAAQFPLEDRQFNLRHMLLAMLLCALALSPLRLVLPEGEWSLPDFDSELFLILLAVVLCNVIVTIPCIWWAFVSTVPLILVSVGWLLYCATLTVVEVAALIAVLGTPRHGGFVGAATLFFAVNVTQCVTVFGVMRIFRAIGYRLVRIAPNPEEQAAI